MRLDGKVAIVTGAGRGIGRGIALALAREGAKLAVNYRRSQQMAQQLAEEICQLGGEAFAVKADISKSSEVDRLTAETVDRFGGLNILVNNAATWVVAPFLEQTEESWDLTLDTNLKGAFLCSRAAAKVMIGEGGGKIVHISSVHDVLTIPGFSCAYAASKGGLVMLTKAMALELAPYHINVNAVSPGATEVERHHRDPSYDREKWGDKIPWGRVGFPQDIANAILFLVSEDAEYVTGQVLYVDGGMTAQLPFETHVGTPNSAVRANQAAH